MTSPRPRNWPDASATNTPSSAASWGFDIAAELARINHPSARNAAGTQSGAVSGCNQDSTPGPLRTPAVRADLRAMPPHGDVEVGRFPMPPSAVGTGASGSRRRPAVGRWIVAGFVAGWLWGRQK